MSATILQEISEKLQQGKAKDIKVLVPQALEAGIPAKDILNDGLLAGMSVIGVKFKNNEVFVPEVLIAARAMKGRTLIGFDVVELAPREGHIRSDFTAASLTYALMGLAERNNKTE